MRYYLTKISYNKIAQAEDRPQPQGFDTLDAAEKQFHSFFAQNILGETIGWCEAFIFDSEMNIHMKEKWEENTNPEDLVEKIRTGEAEYYDVISQYPQYKDYIDAELAKE